MKPKANQQFLSFEVPVLNLRLGAGRIVSYDKEFLTVQEAGSLVLHTIPTRCDWHMEHSF